MHSCGIVTTRFVQHCLSSFSASISGPCRCDSVTLQHSCGIVVLKEKSYSMYYVHSQKHCQKYLPSTGWLGQPRVPKSAPKSEPVLVYSSSRRQKRRHESLTLLRCIESHQYNPSTQRSRLHPTIPIKRYRVCQHKIPVKSHKRKGPSPPTTALRTSAFPTTKHAHHCGESKACHYQGSA
jgi:hypothetical protein